MKKFFAFALSLASLFVLVSCEQVPFSGKFDVKEGFTVQASKGQNLSLSQGNFDGTFQMKDKNTVNLTVGLNTVVFDIPRKSPVPNENGSVIYRGRDMGQVFDLTVVTHTDYENGPSRTEDEMCSYPDSEMVCHYIDGREVCHWERVWVDGYRTVTYHILTKKSSAVISFNAADGARLLAQATGKAAPRFETIYEYQGQCH